LALPLLPVKQTQVVVVEEVHLQELEKREGLALGFSVISLVHLAQTLQEELSSAPEGIRFTLLQQTAHSFSLPQWESQYLSCEQCYNSLQIDLWQPLPP
jgi:hypothetical protein